MTKLSQTQFAAAEDKTMTTPDSPIQQTNHSTAATRLAALIGADEVIETETFTYYGHQIAIAQLVGDPDSDGEDYYGPTAVAWDAALDRPGEPGACYAPEIDSATWFALRWPATTSSGGFLRDGSWTDHPISFGR